MWRQAGVGSCPWQSFPVLLNEGFLGVGGGRDQENLELCTPGNWEREQWQKVPFSCKLCSGQGGAIKAPTRDRVSRGPLPSPAVRRDPVSIVPAPGLHGGMLCVVIGATSPELHVVCLGCHRPAGCFQLKTRTFKVGLKIKDAYQGPGLPSSPLSAGISGCLVSWGAPLSCPLPRHHPHSGQWRAVFVA